MWSSIGKVEEDAAVLRLGEGNACDAVMFDFLTTGHRFR
jgi:hypothetical protein